jgi:hypothetical protein
MWVEYKVEADISIYQSLLYDDGHGTQLFHSVLILFNHYKLEPKELASHMIQCGTIHADSIANELLQFTWTWRLWPLGHRW